MKALACLILFAGSVISSFAQEKVDPLEYYDDILSLHAGETVWFDTPKSSDNQGVRYRAVIISAEVYRTLCVETIRLGEEGSTKLASATMKPFGESILEFVAWMSPTTFLITIDGALKKVEIDSKGSFSLSDAPKRGFPFKGKKK